MDTTTKNLKFYEEDLSAEQIRNLYLRKLATGEIQGPPTGKPSMDKPHLKFYPEEALKLDFPKMTMYDYLKEQSKNHFDDIAIVFDTDFGKNEITYGELFSNIDSLSETLQSVYGIKKGDKVAVSLANTPESVYAFYALSKMGAIYCPIDPRANEYGLERDLKDLDVKMYIGIMDNYKKAKRVCKGLGISNVVITSPINSLNSKVAKSLYISQKALEGNVPFSLKRRWPKLNQNSGLNFVNSDVYEEGSLAAISYTGGTTGVHKGVELSNDALNNMVFSHRYIMENVKRGDVFMNILPQFMIFGMFTLHLALCRGLETHLLLDASPDNFLKNLKRLNPAMAFGGPVHWETLIDNPEVIPGCLSNMKAPVSGGESLPVVKERKINESLIKGGAQETICNGFGASELGGSVTLKEGNKSREGTVGILHVYDNAKIVNPNTGEEEYYNNVGELYVTTPSLMLRYHNNEEESNKAIKVSEDGTRWFATGDLAKIDEDGTIELVGRIKRLFVCGLNNVYPPEMEELIASIPGVKKCAVVPIPDEELRQVPKVHFVIENDTEENRSKIQAATQALIAERIGVEVLPRYYEFNDDLKYTPNGKVDFEGIRKDDIQKMNIVSEKQKVKTNK